MRRLIALAAAILAVAIAGARSAAAMPLVADLSDKEIAITTGFAGTELLLFGALDGPGDVVVVVRGPPRREIVRRKERVAGVWLNGESLAFDEVPGFYFVASTRPLAAIAPEATLKRLQLGIERQIAVPAGAKPEFTEGLLRAMRNRGLYSMRPTPMTVLDGRLFRTRIHFPANVPTGVYRAEVHLFRDGAPVSKTATPVIVRKAGVEARIYDFAHEQSALYGIVAIIVALVAGWLAGVVFRKT